MSAAVRRAVAAILLVGVYVVVFPWYWAATRLAKPRTDGWRARQDATLASTERLRRPF